MGEGGGGRGAQGPVEAKEEEEDGDAVPPPPPPRGGAGSSASWAGCRHAGAGLVETAAQYWATLMVFLQHTVWRWDTYFVCCANLASTLFYVYFEPSGEALVANLNLSFVSFIIIMPVTALITHAFTRREFSHQSISRLKSYLAFHYSAHAQLSSQGAPGPVADTGAAPGQHLAEVRQVMTEMVRTMRAFLSAESLNETPDHTRTAFVSKRFERRRAALKPAQKRQIEAIHLGFQRLHLATERLKQRGLSSTEASRVHQSVFFSHQEWENLRANKLYRTPYGLRAFARLYILLHGFFIGPYYAYIAGAHDSSWYSAEVRAEREYPEYVPWPFQTNVTFAAVLSVFTSISMQALFQVALLMEDHFDSVGLDDIDFGKVADEMEANVFGREWVPGTWAATMAGGSLLDARLCAADGAASFTDGGVKTF